VIEVTVWSPSSTSACSETPQLVSSVRVIRFWRVVRVPSPLKSMPASASAPTPPGWVPMTSAQQSSFDLRQSPISVSFTVSLAWASIRPRKP
jgi:hypothetical protein